MEFVWIKEVAATMGADQLAFFTGLAAAAAVIIQSLRKRKDIDIAEVMKKNETMEARITALEDTVTILQSELIEAEHHRFVLRRELSSRGIPDPTMEASP